MTPSNPFTATTINGDSTRRGVTLEVPKDVVRAFLPVGLELGDQDMTRSGTHPVLLFFNDMFRLNLSFPTLIPNMTYHELHVGIPYTYVSTGPVTPATPGPYYFIPRLYLDNLLAIFGGIVFWGFAKEMATICVTRDSYTVAGIAGRRAASLIWKLEDDDHSRFHPASDYPLFKPVHQAMSQPIISMLPASIGPFFVLSNFDMASDAMMLRPLQTAVEGDREYLPGYPGGRVPASGWSPGIDTSVLGSYELRVPWQLSLPYPPPR